jgi:hypothetical protein
MSAPSELHELAESIKTHIARHGVHVLDRNELSPLLGCGNPGSDFEKRLRLENFASLYGFHVHWSTYLQVAIFRKSGLDDAHVAAGAGN